MALTPTLSLIINGAITEGTLSDDTVYGAPNQLRADVAVYATLSKLAYNLSSTSVTITGDTSDPLTVTEWTWTYTTDGWYQARQVIIDEYNAATVYNRYDAVYYSGVVYRSTSAATHSDNTPPNASFWEVISDPVSLIDNVGAVNESTNISYKIYNEILYPKAQKKFGDAIAEAATDCCSDCKREDDVETYEFLGVMVDSMNLANTRSRFAEGEKIARKTEQFISTC